MARTRACLVDIARPNESLNRTLRIRPRKVPELQRVRRAWRVTSSVKVRWPGLQSRRQGEGQGRGTAARSGGGRGGSRLPAPRGRLRACRLPALPHRAHGGNRGAAAVALDRSGAPRAAVKPRDGLRWCATSDVCPAGQVPARSALHLPRKRHPSRLTAPSPARGAVAICPRRYSPNDPQARSCVYRGLASPVPKLTIPLATISATV